jgi:hypothetical protein
LRTYLREQAEQGWTQGWVEDVAGRMVGRAWFKLSADGGHRGLGNLREPAQ